MDIRPATVTDLAGIATARLSNGPAHHDSGANPDYCRFLIEHGHLWVAVDGSQVLGFGGAIDVGEARLLSDLYVDRDEHGRGVGSALLAAVLDGAADSFTFASAEPAAQAIYARVGMVATWPVSTLHGDVARLPRVALTALDLPLDAAASFEFERTGGHHGDALRYWAARPSNHVLGVRTVDSLCGTAVVHVADGVARVEHLVAGEGRGLEVFTAAALATGAVAVEAYVPEVRALHGQLLAAGFEVTDSSMFMTTRPGVVSDDLQVVHPGLC